MNAIVLNHGCEPLLMTYDSVCVCVCSNQFPVTIVTDALQAEKKRTRF